jgi:hypothetical protein
MTTTSTRQLGPSFPRRTGATLTGYCSTRHALALDGRDYDPFPLQCDERSRRYR